MRGVSFLGDSWYPYVLVVLVAAIFYLKKEKIFSVVLITAPLMGDVIKLILKNLVREPRPGWLGCPTLVDLHDFAMPSGHTIFYTIFFGLLACWGIRKKWATPGGKVLTLISIFMIATIGFSRVYLGAHWILDVEVGYLIGGLVLIGAVRLLEKYEKL